MDEAQQQQYPPPNTTTTLCDVWWEEESSVMPWALNASIVPPAEPLHLHLCLMQLLHELVYTINMLTERREADK